MSFRITHQQMLWGLFLAFGGLMLMMVLSDPAFAQASPVSRNFSCSAGRATGDLIAKSSSCPQALAWDNIFSFMVCHVEVITSQVFGNMYCGIIHDLIPAVKAVLTIAVLMFGIGFTIGVIPATGREFLGFLLRIAFVWAFATQAEYMIGYGYNFLVGGLREGTTIAMSAIMPPDDAGNPVTTAAGMYGFLDRGLVQIIGFATETAGEDWGPGNNPCQNALFAAMLVMAIAFPPLFLLSVMLLFKIIMVFLRSCFGYLFSIVGIAFLMILSPIFLSFALFKQTRAWFDKWLGYLASFTLQMVIIFAAIAMIISMNPSQLVGSLSQLVMPKQEAYQTSGWRWPWEYCTLCKFEVVGENGAVKTLDTNTQIDPATDTLRCKTPREGYAADQMLSPESNSAEVNALFKLTGSVIISLIVLAYIIDQLLFYVPNIAWRLASSLSSSVYAPQVVGGGYAQSATVTAGPLDMLSATGDGFTAGFSAQLRNQETGRYTWTTNTADAVNAGMQRAGQTFMFGSRDGQDPGLVDGFMRFFINPNRSSTGED